VALKSITGSLVASHLLDALARTGDRRDSLASVLTASRRYLGPASGARQILDRLFDPLIAAAGLRSVVGTDAQEQICGCVMCATMPVASFSVGAWAADLRRLRASVSRSPAASRLRWWIGCNGAMVRIVDQGRAYARRGLDVDLTLAVDEEAAARALGALLASDGRGSLSSLESLVDESERHQIAVGRSLQGGVETALLRLIGALSKRSSRREASLDSSLAEALTIVYRILFLLFAEARGLVPGWHPIYRDSYTIESLRPAAEGRRSAAGLWESLQAITRLAQRGCHAGTLRVVPFNGRLFAPSGAPTAESIRLDDNVARDVLKAITTHAGTDRRERISYADLGVEQLGAVYESVLDYSPAIEAGAPVLRSTGRRKRTGTFYTPRSITEYLVRRTLAPLVADRHPEEILRVRVVDPAMGSGAFLVAACRYLADAYEASLVADGSVTPADLGPSERAGFRRAVAQRCLYGVDRNPTAVQLARLSLWLCTLAADRPLTFLDHRLRAGNSIVGAGPEDLARQAPGSARSRPSPLPLFGTDELLDSVTATVREREAVAAEADDTADIVRRKERTIERLTARDSPLGSWRTMADAWCAVWFWPPRLQQPGPRAWGALAAAVRGDGDVPPSMSRTWTAAVEHARGTEGFFHWQLEFPEVFFDSDGGQRADAGFDAVIGNPPWEALRADSGSASDRNEARATARALTRFSRESGCFALQSGGHANLYQLFAERMLQIARPHGRVGMLMPAGLLTDHGCAALRHELLDRCRIDALVVLDNRDAIFPIHRGVRFALVTAVRGANATALPMLSGPRPVEALDDLPDRHAIGGSVHLTHSLIRRFSPDDLAVPDLRSEHDRAVLARILDVAPAFASDAGWRGRVGRELNASDDRRFFERTGMPVLEGKALDPFEAHVERATAFIDRATARRLLGARAAFDRPRLGYREVASSTNRVTLIAAIVPAGVATSHTIFCVREPPEPEIHWLLCGLFNSFVANYLIRLRGGTHVTASMIRELPVPFVPAGQTFDRIVALAHAAGDGVSDARGPLEATVARLYGLDEDAFAHIVSTFPLVAADERRAALDAFRAGIHAL
jgi:Eco57I restriction-modification methylase